MRASRRLILAAACAFCGAPAIAGESIDRLGRLLGVGWSDGYHARGADRYHIGENLPPHSYAADHSRYAVSPHHVPVVKRKTGFDCTDCDQGLLTSRPTSPTVLPMIEDEHFDNSLQIDGSEFSNQSVLEVPTSPYTPTEPTLLPPVEKSSPERMPTPAEPQPDPKNASPKPKLLPDPLDQILPAPIDEDPEELPAPMVEPASPSDAKEARARQLRADQSTSELAPRPKRIGASNPQRLPDVAR